MPHKILKEVRNNGKLGYDVACQHCGHKYWISIYEYKRTEYCIKCFKYKWAEDYKQKKYGHLIGKDMGRYTIINREGLYIFCKCNRCDNIEKRNVIDTFRKTHKYCCKNKCYGIMQSHMNLEDIVGKKFHSYKVIKYVGDKKDKRNTREYWYLIRCLNCKKEHIVRRSSVLKMYKCRCHYKSLSFKLYNGKSNIQYC